MVTRAAGFGMIVLLLSVSALTAQDVTLVRSSGAGAWGAALRLTQEVRIGQVEGEDAYNFGFVVALAVSKAGAIFVGEARPTQLRMYDASGRFVRKIGGDGEGPGEYRQIDGLKTMSDGNIALWDGRTGRISIYDSNGEFRTSHRFSTGFFTSDMFIVDQAGNFYVKANGIRSQPGQFQLDQSLVWIKLNPAGQVVDSIAIPKGPTPAVQTYGGPGNSRVNPLLAALSPLGYFVTGAPTRYSFSIQQLQKPALVVEREHKPVPFTRGEKAEWDAWAEYLSKQPIGRSMRVGPDGKPQTIDGPTTRYTAPSVKPAYRALQVDDEGRIWVERHVEAQQVPEPERRPTNNPPPNANQPPNNRPPTTWREPRTFDVFEPSGRFLGTIVVPQNTTIHVRRGLQVWGVARGEFDENYIVRYRIEPAAR